MLVRPPAHTVLTNHYLSLRKVHSSLLSNHESDIHAQLDNSVEYELRNQLNENSTKEPSFVYWPIASKGLQGVKAANKVVMPQLNECNHDKQ